MLCVFYAIWIACWILLALTASAVGLWGPALPSSLWSWGTFTTRVQSRRRHQCYRKHCVWFLCQGGRRLSASEHRGMTERRTVCVFYLLPFSVSGIIVRTTKELQHLHREWDHLKIGQSKDKQIHLKTQSWNMSSINFQFIVESPPGWLLITSGRGQKDLTCAQTWSSFDFASWRLCVRLTAGIWQIRNVAHHYTWCWMTEMVLSMFIIYMWYCWYACLIA